MTAVAVMGTLKPADEDRLRLVASPWVATIDRQCWKGYDTERLLGGLCLQAVREPKLLECTPESIIDTLIRIGRWGLDIGEYAYAVPMWSNDRKVTEASAWCDYRGLKVLGRRSGIVRSMKEFVVWEGDELDVTHGLHPDLIHRPANPSKRGTALQGAYTVYTVPGSVVPQFFWMSIEEIEERRAMSKKWGPGKIKACPAWYATKSVVREFFAREPRTGVLADAIEATAVPLGEAESLDAVAELKGEAARRAVSSPSPVMRDAGIRIQVERLERALKSPLLSEANREEIRGRAALLTELPELRELAFNVENEIARRRDRRRGEAPAEAPPSPRISIPLCPKCGASCTDERPRKTKDSQPDFKCSNPRCLDKSGKWRTGIWEKDLQPEPVVVPPGAPSMAELEVIPAALTEVEDELPF